MAVAELRARTKIRVQSSKPWSKAGVKSTISFDDPPIKEVVLGRTFLPREDFLLPYFGAFWAQVRKDFPRTEHAPPIIDPSEGVNESALLPRVWFISENATRLIQLQQNRFHYNWRQTHDLNTYVRFPVVQAECLALWRKFDEFVLEATGRPLQPLKAELIYTNIVEIPGATKAIEVAEEVLLEAAWGAHDRFLPPPRAFSRNYTFELPVGKGDLVVVATAAKRKDTNAPALKLELTVKGECLGENSFEEWSNSAHDFLVNAFKDLTKPSMHAKWKLREK